MSSKAVKPVWGAGHSLPSFTPQGDLVACQESLADSVDGGRSYRFGPDKKHDEIFDLGKQI